MHVEGVLAAHVAAHLADGFDERHGLDVADGAADFHDHHIGVLLLATRLMRRLISLVTCGTTWIVSPR